MPKHTRKILAVLESKYGSPRLGNYANPLDEVLFIILSLQTEYKTYHETFKKFKRRFKPWDKLLRASEAQIAKCIKRGGLGPSKAHSFSGIAKKLKADFGRVTLAPIKAWDDESVEKYLCSLPGVGIKTARCVMMYSLGRDVLPVDTHTYRVGVRMGLIPKKTLIADSHPTFDRIVPKGRSYSMHTNFVALGREICVDPAPKCCLCPAKKLCRNSPKPKR